MFFNTLLAATGLAALSSAHILISEPKPFAVPALRNGPLAPDGSDFPCQSPDGIYDARGASNVMPLGSKQPLAFVGSAVHGGGSCQVSITYDNPPTKNSVWKVIHSIEGGCPARDTPGNLGNDANLKVPFDYSFPIPDNIPTGNATVAWTWLNKIGNREFYMNCAPATLTGSGGDKANWEALPDMLVANIGNGCTTVEGKDYKYPSPGKSVQSFASGDLVFPQGNCGSAVRPPAGGDGGGSGTPPGTGSPVSAAPTAVPTKKIPGGVFITVTTSDKPSTPTQDTPVVVPIPEPSPAKPTAPSAPVPTAAPPAAPPATPPSTPGGATGAFAPGTACSSEGQWNCIAGTSFQRCASGSWSVTQALAAGTACKPGTTANMEITAATLKGRRVPRRLRR